MANEMILKNGLRTTALKVGNYNFPSSGGTLDQVLKIDSNGDLVFGTNPAGGIQNVVEDTTPQLGGNLDVNSFSLVTLSNANLVLAPDGTGSVDVSNKKIINLATPTSATDAATMAYADTKLSSISQDTAPTLGGNLTIGSHSIVAGTGNDLTVAIDDGKMVKLGSLNIMAPETISPVTVSAGVQYSFTFSFSATVTSTYVDYIFMSTAGSKMGTIFILSDGTSVSITDMGTELGTPSIDFAASISAGNVTVVGTNMAATSPSGLKITMRQMS